MGSPSSRAPISDSVGRKRGMGNGGPGGGIKRVSVERGNGGRAGEWATAKRVHFIELTGNDSGLIRSSFL